MFPTFTEYLRMQGFMEDYLSTLTTTKRKEIYKNYKPSYRRYKCREIYNLKNQGYNWKQIAREIGQEKASLIEFYDRWAKRGYLGDEAKYEVEHRKTYPELLKENKELKNTLLIVRNILDTLNLDEDNSNIILTMLTKVNEVL